MDSARGRLLHRPEAEAPELLHPSPPRGCGQGKSSNQSLWSSVSQSDFHKLCTLHERLSQQETGTGFSRGLASIILQTCFAKEHYFYILFYSVFFCSMSTDGKFHEFWSAGTCLHLQGFPDCVALGARLEPGSSGLPSPCCLVSTGRGTYDHTCFGVWGRVQNNKFTWAFLKERCSQIPTAITTETFDRPGSWISVQLRSEGLSRGSTFGSLRKSDAEWVAFPSSASELFAAEGGWGRHGGPPVTPQHSLASHKPSSCASSPCVQLCLHPAPSQSVFCMGGCLLYCVKCPRGQSAGALWVSARLDPETSRSVRSPVLPEGRMAEGQVTETWK